MTKPLNFIGGKINESYGVIENLVATTIFSLPNFLLFAPYFHDKIYIFVVYNYAVLLIILTTLSHYKFRN